jgi:hypothetical protein
MNQLIHCVNCHAIFLKTPFDQREQYEFSSLPSPENIQNIDRDDFQDFLRNHKGHRLENLRIIQDSFISEKPYFEPLKISYFKATNGKESFVIKKFRESIDEPLKYQLILGDYSLECTGIEIQTEEIAKQLAGEFKQAPLPPRKINTFLKLCRHISETVDIKNLERVPQESPHPLEIYYKMDDLSTAYLLRNCHNMFKGQQYSEIEAFIQRHREDGVLLLKVAHRIKITKRAQARRKAGAGQISIENKKVAEKI